MVNTYIIAGHRFRVEGAAETACLSCLPAYSFFEEETEVRGEPATCPFCHLVASEDWLVRFGGTAEQLTDEEDLIGCDRQRNAVRPNGAVELTADDEVASAPGEVLAQPAVGQRLYAFLFPETQMRCIFSKRGEVYFFQMCSARAGQTPLLMRYDEGSHTVLSTGAGDAVTLHFALWFAYAMLSAAVGLTPVHASTVVWHGQAVMVLGESGTGKSTHTRLWCEHIQGAWLLNDDSPLLSAASPRPWVYGSPWSGKTPCYRNEGYPLRAIVRLSQASANSFRRLRPVEAVAALQPSCPPALSRDERFNELIMDLIQRTLAAVPVYHLACLPDAAAAQLCFSAVFGGQATK